MIMKHSLITEFQWKSTCEVLSGSAVDLYCRLSPNNKLVKEKTSKQADDGNE